MNFLSKGSKLLTGKNEGQFVFTLGGLWLAVITVSLFMVVLLSGANAAQNATNFSDSAKLLFALVPFFFFVGAFMILVNSNS